MHCKLTALNFPKNLRNQKQIQLLLMVHFWQLTRGIFKWYQSKIRLRTQHRLHKSIRTQLGYKYSKYYSAYHASYKPFNCFLWWQFPQFVSSHDLPKKKSKHVIYNHQNHSRKKPNLSLINTVVKFAYKETYKSQQTSSKKNVELLIQKLFLKIYYCYHHKRQHHYQEYYLVVLV